MYEYNASTIFMPLEAAQNYFDHENGVTDIEIILSNHNLTNAVTREIALLSDDRMMVVDFSKSNEQLVAALTVERNVMF